MSPRDPLVHFKVFSTQKPEKLEVLTLNVKFATSQVDATEHAYTLTRWGDTRASVAHTLRALADEIEGALPPASVEA